MKITGFRFAQSVLILILPVCLLLTACEGAASSRQTGSRAQEESESFYLPPAPTATSTALVKDQFNEAARSAGSVEAGAVPTLQCTDGLSFLQDLTLPDGTKVATGASLDKRWQVANSGTCNFDNRYRLRLLAGPEMGAQPEAALYPALSGTEFVIRILFQAPAEPGQYRSAWQAYNPDDQPFGDPIFIDIAVER